MLPEEGALRSAFVERQIFKIGACVAAHPKPTLRSEAVTTNDSCRDVSLPPASMDGSRRDAASSAIDEIKRSRSAASLSFKSAAIGVAVS